MKRVLRQGLLIFLLCAQGLAVYAQAGPDRPGQGQPQAQQIPWESLLDSYELICRKCITLKQRQDAGEAIPSRQLLSLMDELDKLRGELKNVSDKMPAVARQRYNAIRQMYTTGVIVDTRPDQLPAPGCGFLPSDASTKAATALPEFAPLPVAPRPWEHVATISAVVSVPELSYGISGSYWGQRLGAWGTVRSTFSHHSVAYDAFSDGSCADGRIWTSGEAATDRLFATAGPLVRISKNVALFGGAGYGFKRLCWEDSNGDWMLVGDISGSGICYEAGASVLLGRSVLGLSWLYLPGTCHTINLSVGINLY